MDMDTNIKKDIEFCNNLELETNTHEYKRWGFDNQETNYECTSRIGEMLSIYSSVIPEFDKGIINDINSLNRNAKIISRKLQNYLESKANNSMSVTVNNIVNIDVSFVNARENVNNMASISRMERDEILEKLKDIETIIKSNEDKIHKWERLSDILKWVADKGVDVGIALLPLILQIA
jgi:uncharacterized protein (UPF0297 family)